MANMLSNFIFFFLVAIVMIDFSDSLNTNYYEKSCPKAQNMVTMVVKKAMANDNTVQAALLRMHFHDCFIRGCDGSVLLKSTNQNTAERDGPPNISLHAFYVIDNAKKAVESICPGVVSCADILALAARDAVALSGGPIWAVPLGRKDGRISRASETRQLPAPTFNFSQLKLSFARRGLSTADLVALSGGHSLGFAHCSSFQNRIHNFSKNEEVDPSLSASFAARLRQTCPANNKTRNAGTTMDTTATVFDNVYFKLLLQGKSLFSSDQALLFDRRAKQLVTQFASSQEEFKSAFVRSMVRMSSLTGEGLEVRLDCKVVT